MAPIQFRTSEMGSKLGSPASSCSAAAAATGWCISGMDIGHFIAIKVRCIHFQGGHPSDCFKDWDDDGAPDEGECPTGYRICALQTRIRHGSKSIEQFVQHTYVTTSILPGLGLTREVVTTPPWTASTLVAARCLGWTVWTLLEHRNASRVRTDLSPLFIIH